ncbi:MAG TPA: TonB-dependent receptor [Pyrinomonadaceae bacterium]|nr:TonB-dependent receptor [Pyrinomonadaceae bacterium]
MRDRTSLLLPLVCSFAITAAAQQASGQNQSSLHGSVVDARSGEALAKVIVVVSGTDLTATTDEKGEFTIKNVPVGPVDLYFTTVNYGLVKKSVVIKDGVANEATLILNEDAAALTESVSIGLGPYEDTETNVASEQKLNKRELQSLSSILIGDPVRAAQALPGVSTGDDFRSEFSLRGAGFDRIGLYVDGVLTENFVHTIQGGYLDTGSLSVINADTVANISLFSAAFPSKYGDSTGSILDFTTRDGNRIKPTARITAALSGIAGIVDGPIADGKGSYLLAGRKSFLGYLIRKINDTNQFTNSPPILNLADIHGKTIYELTKRNQIGLSVIYGELDFDRNRDRNLLFINTVFRGHTTNLLANGHWSFTPDSKTLWQTRVFGLRTNFRNLNRNEDVLDEGDRTQFGARSDVSFQPHRQHQVETGVYVRRVAIDSLSQSFFFSSGIFDSIKLQHSDSEVSYFAQDTWSNDERVVSLTMGARVEHAGLAHHTVISPRVAVSWSPGKSWRVKAGGGRYYQFPDLEHLFGRLGNPNLRAESATHYNISVERLFGDRLRVLAEVYDREDRNLFFSLSEPRLVNNVVSFDEFPFHNGLNGHARGFELTLQRRSANKLGGWVSYAYSRTRLQDSQTGLRFVSDTDQHHTVNAYGSYRFTDLWSLSGEWRYGSGPPIPGFYAHVGADYFLTNQRNLVRVPDYSRVDVRVSKAFLFRRWKLTVTGEVINLLNKENLRFAGFDSFAGDGRVFGRLDRLLPILPSAGVVVEF